MSYMSIDATATIHIEVEPGDIRGQVTLSVARGAEHVIDVYLNRKQLKWLLRELERAGRGERV
jgi:hypothetical protein